MNDITFLNYCNFKKKGRLSIGDIAKLSDKEISDEIFKMRKLISYLDKNSTNITNYGDYRYDVNIYISNLREEHDKRYWGEI